MHTDLANTGRGAPRRPRLGFAGLAATALAMACAAGCVRCDAPPPPAPEAAAPQSAPVVRDAAPDATDAMDARSDAGDGPARHAARKTAAAPPRGGGGGIKVEGSLPKADAERVVRAGFAKIRACNPSLPGRVMFRLTVDDRGRVTLGEVVSSTLANGDPEMCMIRTTRDLKFPAAPGGATVSFPLTFGR